jgi:hypothetical protein
MYRMFKRDETISFTIESRPRVGALGAQPRILTGGIQNRYFPDAKIAEIAVSWSSPRDSRNPTFHDFTAIDIRLAHELQRQESSASFSQEAEKKTRSQKNLVKREVQ